MLDFGLFTKEEPVFEDYVEFFHAVSRAEYYIHTLRGKDSKSFFRLKQEASKLDNHEIDPVIFDCAFTEEPKLVRYVLQTIDVSQTESSFDHAKKNISGMSLRYWRDFLRGSLDIDPNHYFLYLNFFTRFAGRTGKGVDLKMLEDLEFLEGQYQRDWALAKVLTFNYAKINATYAVKVVRSGAFEEVALEESNTALTNKINDLLGGSES